MVKVRNVGVFRLSRYKGCKEYQVIVDYLGFLTYLCYLLYLDYLSTV